MADDAIQSFLTTYEPADGAPGSIPERHTVTCCCGDASCAYLKHNQDALDGLERDVLTAAQLGKALLLRHETYIADSERERKAMTVQIEYLEGAKLELERKNAAVIEENRSLLDELEGLNNSLVDSNAQVTSLHATLQSTHQELHKLSQLASRTARLEQELADFEREQAFWQTSIEAKEQSEKSALRRWQEAQRTLVKLQDQIEHIEKEAKDERERHDEVVSRMERRHAVEKELNSAAGRLKGAAAWKSAGNQAEGTTVVSHFVKDILQDNANLQMGIVELRDMLHNSNGEVENLRKQLSVHQPTDLEEDEEVSRQAIQRPALGDEMRRATAQELHVHHHYHAPQPATASKPTNLRRPKKKRYGSLTSGHFLPSSGTSTPRSSFSHGVPSSSVAILSQTAASLPEHIPINNRWSMHSAATYQTTSSGPSSPQSTHHGSSVFDRVFSDAGHDSSRPSTPDTEDLGSPLIMPVKYKRGSNNLHPFGMPAIHRARPSLDSIVDTSLEDLRQFEPPQGTSTEHAIPEEDEEHHDDEQWDDTTSPAFESSIPSSAALDDDESPLDFAPSSLLRRAASHESLISISGMDIHTLRSRPSQLLTVAGARAFTPQATVTDTTAHASLMSGRSISGLSLLSDMMITEQHTPRATRPTPIRDSRTVSGSSSKSAKSSRTGGWMFGRWGATPVPSFSISPASSGAIATTASTTRNASAKSAASALENAISNFGGAGSTRESSVSGRETSGRAPSVASGSDGRSSSMGQTYGEDLQATPRKGSSAPLPMLFRAPGINQMGPIPGFGPEVKVLHPPIMGALDREGLRKVLGEE